MKIQIRTIAAVITLVVVGLAPAVAIAQGTPEEASLHFRRGATLYDEQDYRAALAEFKRAYLLSPNPTVLFNIGQSHYQLQEYAAALDFLGRYLAEAGSTAPVNRKEMVEKEIAELRGRVAKVEIRTNVAGAEVTVDDEVVGKSPTTVTISAGRRKISARADGYVRATKTLDIASGAAPPIDLELTREATNGTTAPSADRSQTPSTSEQPPPSGGSVSTLAYVGFGVGATGIVVGSVFGLMAMSKRSELHTECPNKVCPDTSHVRGEHEELQRSATISTIGFVVGGVGLLAGGYFLFFSPKPAAASAARSARGGGGGPHVQPWIAGTAGGISGSF